MSVPVKLHLDRFIRFRTAHDRDQQTLGRATLAIDRSNASIAKFHYTGPTGPAPTRTEFFCGPGLRETPLGPCGFPTKSVRVRAGPVGPV